MSKGEIFIPDPWLEAEKLVVVEHAIGEGGLIDKHLKWVDTVNASSADISVADYGYVPLRFTGSNEDMRPGREPVDFQALATNILHLPYDTDYVSLAQRVQEVESGWFDYVVAVDLVNEDTGKSMRTAAEEAYRLDTLTEDNLPAYVSLLLGEAKALAKALGVEIPAFEEWSRGIWTGEENAHMLSMNEYGKITNITTSREHAAGRTSQLRAGTEIPLRHLIQLFVYTAWQELSTNFAHTRDGDLFGPVGRGLLSRIGKDEALHHDFYQTILEALYGEFMDDTLRTLHSELMSPPMPGRKGIANFRRRSLDIHKSAIFGVEHAHKAARKVLEKLGVLDEAKDKNGLSPEAIQARTELRERYKDPMPLRERKNSKFVLDITVTRGDLSEVRKGYAKEIGLAA